MNLGASSDLSCERGRKPFRLLCGGLSGLASVQLLALAFGALEDLLKCKTLPCGDGRAVSDKDRIFHP